MNTFTLIPANNFMWNQDEFLKFLIDNQGNPIEIYTRDGGVCLTSTGVYDTIEKFKYDDVTIISSNLLESHPKFKIKFLNPFKFFKLAHSNYQQFHYWNENKIFGCFYNRPLWFRLGLAAVLQHDYSQITLLNMRSPAQHTDDRRLFEISQLFNYHPESFVKFSKVFNTWPITVEQNDGYIIGVDTTPHTDPLAEFYTDFLIDIVAETWITGQTFFCTEKTIRPMLLKKPFIAFASKDYLCYLRQLGFMTFNNCWDEDYDGYEGVDRYVRILQLIDTISKKSKQELTDMYWSLKYVLDHNYELLKNQTYQTKVTKLD